MAMAQKYLFIAISFYFLLCAEMSRVNWALRIVSKGSKGKMFPTHKIDIQYYSIEFFPLKIFTKISFKLHSLFTICMS